MSMATGHRYPMAVATECSAAGPPKAAPSSSSTRHGEGSVASFSPPKIGLSATSPYGQYCSATVARATSAIRVVRIHSCRRSSGQASPRAISTALIFIPQARPISTPITTSPHTPETRRATWIAQIAAAATSVSRWPPLTSCWMSTGFAVQNRVARTGSSEVLSSSHPTPMKTAPLRIIRAQTVMLTFGPPIDAAKDWITVANGPYTDGCVFHSVPTAWV